MRFESKLIINCIKKLCYRTAGCQAPNELISVLKLFQEVDVIELSDSRMVIGYENIIIVFIHIGPDEQEIITDTLMGKSNQSRANVAPNIGPLMGKNIVVLCDIPE